MSIISWIVKNKTKEVIRGILEGIIEFWNDCWMKRKEPDTYTESENVEKEYNLYAAGCHRKGKSSQASSDNDALHKKDPTKVMRGY